MASDRNRLLRATRLALAAQRTEEPEDEQPALDLLGLPEVERNANLSRAGRGRPPGARNLATREWCDHLLRKYGSPLEVLAQMARAPTDAVARELGCTRLEAYTAKRHAAESLAPFLHPKLATVEVHPPGHPDGPPSILTLAPQDWAELADGTVEAAVEASDAGESAPEAPDDENIETVVEEALDAALRCALDPRYAEAIRRRLKALK
jgi:hypothetical protein